MRVRLGVVLLVTVALLVAIGIGGCGSADEGGTESGGEPIKIGAILSVTGSYAGLGESERNAIELEVEAINEAGGVNGRELEVIIEDDATDEAKAVAAAAKLIDQDEVVAILGATGTGQTMAVRNEVRRAGIPLVSMAGGSVITDDFDPLVFQTPWPNRLVVPFILDVMVEQGWTDVALISDAGGYGKDGRDVILGAVEGAGVTIVADETFNPGDSDMSAQLTKIRAAEPDAIMMWTAGSEAVTVAKNKAQLGIGVPLVGGPGIARREFAEGAGPDAEGVILAAGKILLPETYGEDTEAYDVAMDFIGRYEERFGEQPDIFAGHAYDALYLTVEALERLPQDFTPAELRDEIEATSGFVGMDGTFTFSADDHNGLTEEDLFTYEISEGEWVPFGE